MRRRPRKQYTPEELAAREAADTEIKAGAAELLADPAAVAAMVEHLTTTRSAKLLSYSLRNAAMLTAQATARAMTLIDVDSYEGWCARGRQVRRNEKGLRLRAYRGTKPDSDAAEESGENGSPRRRKFNMTSVFDISQTDPQDDNRIAEPHEVEPVADSAGVLRANLIEQFERLGYTVTTTTDQPSDVAAHPDGHVVDDEARTVAVSVDHGVGGVGGVRELAAALAGLLTRPVAERPTLSPLGDQVPVSRARSRAVDAPGDSAVAPAKPRPLLLPLGGHYGSARVAVRTDWDSGRAYYTLSAPRVRGTWTLSIADPADTEHVTAVDVDYGERSGHHFYRAYAEQGPDQPRINGIPIVGGTHSIRLDNINNLDRWSINCQRPTGPYSSRAAPDRTAAHMAAAVRAVLRHFTARPDLPELHRAAARAAAPQRLREETNEATNLDDQIQNLLAEREQHTRRAERLAGLAAGQDQLDFFPGGPHAHVDQGS